MKIGIPSPRTTWRFFVVMIYVTVAWRIISAMANGMSGTFFLDHVVFVMFIITSVVNAIVIQVGAHINVE